MTKLAITEELQVMECWHCHMTYAITQRFRTDRMKDHKTFWCPAGHGAVFSGQNSEEKLKQELQETQRKLANSQAATRAARDQADAAEAAKKTAERRRRAAVGQNTKLKNRIANGVCPCCNRSFADLGKHMAGQHPDFALARDAD